MTTLSVPREPRRLGFDPSTMFLNQVFQDDIARSIWLLVSAQHLVGEDLADWSLYLARMIRKHKPASVRDLFKLIEETNSILSRGIPGYITGTYEEVWMFVERLLGAVHGSRPVQFTIEISAY